MDETASFAERQYLCNTARDAYESTFKKLTTNRPNCDKIIVFSVWHVLANCITKTLTRTYLHNVANALLFVLRLYQKRFILKHYSGRSPRASASGAQMPTLQINFINHNKRLPRYPRPCTYRATEKTSMTIPPHLQLT